MNAPSAVEIAAADGCRLQGLHWPGRGDWVVLVHGVGSDLDGWRPLCEWLAAEEWNVLAVDARGHGGSGGEWHEDALGADVATMVGFAAGQGARRVYLGLENCAHRRVCNELPEPGVDGVFAFGCDVSHDSCPLRVPYLAICSGPQAPRQGPGVRGTQSRRTVAVYLPSNRIGLDVLRGSWAQHTCEWVAGHLRLWRGQALVSRPAPEEVLVDAGH